LPMMSPLVQPTGLRVVARSRRSSEDFYGLDVGATPSANHALHAEPHLKFPALPPPSPHDLGCLGKKSGIDSEDENQERMTPRHLRIGEPLLRMAADLHPSATPSTIRHIPRSPTSVATRLSPTSISPEARRRDLMGPPPLSPPLTPPLLPLAPLSPPLTPPLTPPLLPLAPLTPPRSPLHGFRRQARCGSSLWHEPHSNLSVVAEGEISPRGETESWLPQINERARRDLASTRTRDRESFRQSAISQSISGGAPLVRERSRELPPINERDLWLPAGLSIKMMI